MTEWSPLITFLFHFVDSFTVSGGPLPLLGNYVTVFSSEVSFQTEVSGSERSGWDRYEFLRFTEFVQDLVSGLYKFPLLFEIVGICVTGHTSVFDGQFFVFCFWRSVCFVVFLYWGLVLLLYLRCSLHFLSLSTYHLTWRYLLFTWLYFLYDVP